MNELEAAKQSLIEAVRIELAEASKRDAEYRAAYDAAALKRHVEAEASAERRTRRAIAATIVSGVATALLTRDLSTSARMVVSVANTILKEMDDPE